MPVRIETLSVRPLEQLPHHDGATWLDREMTSNRPERLSGGFGADVRKSLAQRQAWLVEQGLAQQEGQGIRTRRNLLLVLQQRELDRTSRRSEELTSELQSLMRISYAVFCLKKKTHSKTTKTRI